MWAINLFIDTNIFLKFFHYTNDDLEELNKLIVALDMRKINLYLSEQVVDEFKRNRENKINDALKNFKSATLYDQFPWIVKHNSNYQNLVQSWKDYEKYRQTILEELSAEILSHSLKADKIIGEIFEKAKRIQVSDNILIRVQKRTVLWNPPWKNNSLGDAINWEILLEETELSWEDIYFVTEDSDFISKYNNKYFNDFLIAEWKEKKWTNINYYPSLSSFFRQKYPDIKLASELSKNYLIESLVGSWSFSTTRSCLNAIKKIKDELTANDLNDIILASISNSQIYWIKNDTDIRAMLFEIIKWREDKLNPEVYNQFVDLYSEDPIEIESIPF